MTTDGTCELVTKSKLEELKILWALTWDKVEKQFPTLNSRELYDLTTVVFNQTLNRA